MKIGGGIKKRRVPSILKWSLAFGATVGLLVALPRLTAEYYFMRIASKGSAYTWFVDLELLGAPATPVLDDCSKMMTR